MSDSVAAVGEKDYVLLSKKIRVKLARNDDEKLNGCFSICFWLYIDSCASFPSVILEQRHLDIMSCPPLVWLDGEKKMTLFPILFLHQESPSPDDSFPWTGVPCTSMQGEFPMKKWVHVGCEWSRDFVRLHIDGEVVGESSLTCTLDKIFYWMNEDSKLDKDSYANAFKKLHFACPNDIQGKFHGYLHGLDLCPLSAVKDHLVKDPPLRLFIHHSSASEMDEDSGSVWNIVGGKLSTRRIFSLSVSLLDAFSCLVMKNFEVVASLLYADNQAPVENNGDGEPPLLLFLDGVEYSARFKPCKLENGCAVFKLKISQLSSKCDNRLFQIRVGIPELGSYPFLETLSIPIRCVSSSRSTKMASLIQNKSSNKTDDNVDGLGVTDESMELIPDIVHEMKPSPSLEQVKLGQQEQFEVFKEDIPLELRNNKTDNCVNSLEVNDESMELIPDIVHQVESSPSPKRVKLEQQEPLEVFKEDIPLELPNNKTGNNVDGLEVNDESMELIPDIVHLVESSPSPNRVKLGQQEQFEVFKEDIALELPNNKTGNNLDGLEVNDESMKLIPDIVYQVESSPPPKRVKLGQQQFEVFKEEIPLELPNNKTGNNVDRLEVNDESTELIPDIVHQVESSPSPERVKLGQQEQFELFKEDIPAELPNTKTDNNVDGLGVNDESGEFIPDIVHEMESGPSPKRVKLRQQEQFEVCKEDTPLELPNNKIDNNLDGLEVNDESIPEMKSSPSPQRVELGKDKLFEVLKEDLALELPNNKCASLALINNELVKLGQDEPFEMYTEDLHVEHRNDPCDSHASISNELVKLGQNEPFEMCKEDLPVELQNNPCDSHASISNEAELGQDEPFEMCQEDLPVELPNNQCDSHALKSDEIELEPFEMCQEDLPVELPYNQCDSPALISNEKWVELGQDEPSEMCKEDLPVELQHNQCNFHASENARTNIELENSYRAENNPTTSNGGEASTSDPKKMLDVSSAFLDLIIFKYCLGNHGERCLLLKEMSTSVSEQQLVNFADGVSLYSGCLHHKHQIRISRRLIAEGIQAWTSISQNHIEVRWNNLLLFINEQFLKIARCTRSLKYQEFEFLRRIAGCEDLVYQENFERMWCWLYPVALTLSQSVVTPIWDSVSPVWMEGFISKEEAESALCRPGGGPEDPGTFILRFPASRCWPHPDAGSLVITYVGTDYVIHHRLLSHDIIHSSSSKGRNGRLLSEMLLDEPELSRLGRMTSSRWRL